MGANKKYLTIGVIVIVVLLLIGIGGNLLRSNKQAVSSASPTPTEEVMPTVDSSVQVDLTSATGGKNVTLKIGQIPSGTSTVDYELSYQTVKQGLQGVIGTITLSNGESNYEKDILLGTCSSGVCIYHQVVGKINLTLKFTGDYGQKIFQKDYSL